MKKLMQHLGFKEFIVLQRGFDLPKKEMCDGPYPVVGSTSIIGFHSEYKIEPPGVVTGRSGSLGFVQYIRERYWPHNTSLWVKDFKGNLPQYVFYFLKTLNLQRFNSGVGVPTLNRNDLDTFEVSIHPLPTQCKIAAILSTYDDLIENNLRRIKVLEEMAQNLYDDWFVKFRFPGHKKVRMVDSPLGRIAEGWEVKRVKDIVIRLKAKKVYEQHDVMETGNIMVIDQSSNEFLGFHDDDADLIASSSSPIIIFGDHTCKMQLLVEPFSIGPNVVPFTAKDGQSTYYLFSLIHNLVETREYKRHWTELANKEVVYSHSIITKQFDNYVEPLFRQVDILRSQMLILHRTRDLLLPKLISSELDVSALDIETGDNE